jgi:hypothetical protein
MKEVGLSLQEAMMAFDKVFVIHLSAHENFCCMLHINLMSFFPQAKYDDAVELLLPVRDDILRIGGSNAQVLWQNILGGILFLH